MWLILSSDYLCAQEAVETLEHYLELVKIWMWANKLRLNLDKMGIVGFLPS